MSTLIGLKLNGAAVLATDSILYTHEGRILSTSQEKIFEVAPGLFYGWSGPRALAIDQARIAAELGRTKGYDNLYLFADALNLLSKPALERPRVLSEEQAAGEMPFFLYILAGLNEGVPGLLICMFSLKNGEVHRQLAGDFRPDTENQLVRFITGESTEEMVKNPETWVDGLTGAAEKFVDYMRKSDPKHYGGQAQIATVDKGGGRWVRRLTQEGIGGVRAALADGLTFVSGKIAPNLGGGVHVNSSTGQIEVDNVEIGAFASSVRPIALFSSDPALPDANYPTGTYGFNVTSKTFKRVNDAGNAWVLAVNGGKDIQAGTVTATQIDTASLNAAVAALGYATISYLSANYANLTTLAATYATIANLEAKTFTADKIVGGTCTATVSFTSPNITGGTITGSTLTCTANGVTTQINNTTPGGPFNAGAGINMTRTSDNSFSAMTPVEVAIVHPSGVGYSILARSLSGFHDYGYLRLQQHGTSGAALLEATGLLTLTESGGTQGSLSPTRLALGGNIVVQTRQIGPGNPSFASLADAQAWCQNLLNALRAHGLIT